MYFLFPNLSSVFSYRIIEVSLFFWSPLAPDQVLGPYLQSQRMESHFTKSVVERREFLNKKFLCLLNLFFIPSFIEQSS